MEMGMKIDRLSLLPNDLLIRILSLLELEEAARSSLLSKRWQYLWTNFKSLKFKETAEEIDLLNKFKARVHAVLHSYRGAILDFLNLKFIYDKSLDSDIHVWIELAYKNKVRVFTLFLQQRAKTGSFIEYRMPEIIYSNPWLRMLELQRCIMPLPSSTVEWRSITSIHFRNCILPQQVVDKITSACPTLTHMALTECQGFNRIEIGCWSFRTLTVSIRDSLEISAQNIERLQLTAFPVLGVVQLSNVVSVEEVEVWMNVSDEELVSPVLINNVQQTFQMINCANHLEFGIGTFKAISGMRIHNLHLPQFKAEYMAITMSDDEVDIYSAITILQSSPFLKKLRINGCEEEYTNWDVTTEFNLSCELPHLKNVEITIYTDEVACKSTFSLAKTLRKRAPFLEQMIINLDESYPLPSPPVEKYLINIFETLFTYPKSSEKATIVIY